MQNRKKLSYAAKIQQRELLNDSKYFAAGHTSLKSKNYQAALPEFLKCRNKEKDYLIQSYLYQCYKHLDWEFDHEKIRNLENALVCANRMLILAPSLEQKNNAWEYYALVNSSLFEKTRLVKYVNNASRAMDNLDKTRDIYQLQLANYAFMTNDSATLRQMHENFSAITDARVRFGIMQVFLKANISLLSDEVQEFINCAKGRDSNVHLFMMLFKQCPHLILNIDDIKNKNSAHELLDLATMYANNSSHKKAEEIYEYLLEKFPKYAKARSSYGYFLSVLHQDNETAIDVLLPILEEKQSVLQLIKTYRLLANCYLNIGKDVLALHFAKAGLALEPYDGTLLSVRTKATRNNTGRTLAGDMKRDGFEKMRTYNSKEYDERHGTPAEEAQRSTYNKIGDMDEVELLAYHSSCTNNFNNENATTTTTTSAASTSSTSTDTISTTSHPLEDDLNALQRAQNSVEIYEDARMTANYNKQCLADAYVNLFVISSSLFNKTKDSYYEKIRDYAIRNHRELKLPVINKLSAEQEQELLNEIMQEEQVVRDRINMIWDELESEANEIVKINMVEKTASPAKMILNSSATVFAPRTAFASRTEFASRTAFASRTISKESSTSSSTAGFNPTAKPFVPGAATVTSVSMFASGTFSATTSTTATTTSTTMLNPAAKPFVPGK